jgi:glutamate-1-semialdehyde 2,1-aminomutase
MVVPYGTVPDIGDDVAAVIVEPIAANMGVVAPAPGFLEGLRAACDRAGALLVFDEVITGFRLGPDGAQGRLGVRPDLTCFGKVIGGGLPIGAVGGRRDVMENLTPVGKVFHAGTLAGNPLATAAGLAALGQLTPDVYEGIEAGASRLQSTIDDALSSAGLSATVSRIGTLVGIFLGDGLTGATGQRRSPVDFDEAKRTDEALYARLFHALLHEGVAMAPGAYEALFVGAAHDDAVLDELAERFHRAARSLGA